MPTCCEPGCALFPLPDLVNVNHRSAVPVRFENRHLFRPDKLLKRVIRPAGPRESETATYNVGDYVKVKFHNESTGIGEWMWIHVHHCDEEKQLGFGTLEYSR
jgi:hypothetical protein